MHVEISKFDIHVIHRPDTEGNGRDVRALLHERAQREPEGVEQGVLVLVLVRILNHKGKIVSYKSVEGIMDRICLQICKPRSPKY